MANVPGVMVSSTFYDLRQVRADLARFIDEELGYRSLLSEFPSFPIDPDFDTIENCRRRVERDADILVLIIGGRYGFVEKQSSKSVTNLEYLAARAKGIPIYAFVDKQVLAALPIWEKNPQADFSSVVSDPRVFGFINQVRTVDRVWTYGFELAQEIVKTLRSQFAFLMRTGLDLNLKLSRNPHPVLEGLHGRALRLALEQPAGWEAFLFLRVLSDEVETISDLRREHRLGIAVGLAERVDLSEIHHWMQARLGELRRMIDAANVLMKESLQEALGPPGAPGDAASIVFVARQIGALYRHAIEWSQKIRRTHMDECFQPVAREMAKFTDDMIEKIERFGPESTAAFEEALAQPETGVQRQLDMTLVLDFSNADGFEAALEKAQRDCFGIT